VGAGEELGQAPVAGARDLSLMLVVKQMRTQEIGRLRGSALSPLGAEGDMPQSLALLRLQVVAL
jgi:hypothetical protein